MINIASNGQIGWKGINQGTINMGGGTSPTEKKGCQNTGTQTNLHCQPTSSSPPPLHLTFSQTYPRPLQQTFSPVNKFLYVHLADYELILSR